MKERGLATPRIQLNTKINCRRYADVFRAIFE